MYRVKVYNEIEKNNVMVYTAAECCSLHTAILLRHEIEGEMYAALDFISDSFLHEVRIVEVIETEREVTKEEIAEDSRHKVICT